LIITHQAVTDEEFDSYKEGIYSRLMEPDQRLTGHAGRFWAEILSSSIPSSLTNVSKQILFYATQCFSLTLLLKVEFEVPQFDRRVKEASFIQTVTKDKIIEFAEKLLLPTGPKRRLLVSQVSSTKNRKNRKLADKLDQEYTEILDVQKYIEQMQLL
jgi:secreted Zn-dependent insulinase-like peptidase